MFLEGASEFSPAIIRAVRPGVLGRTVSAMQNGLNMLLQMAEDAGLNDPEHLVTIFGAEDVDPKYQLWDKEKKGLYEAASNVLAGPSSASPKATFVAQLETFCKHTRDLNKRYITRVMEVLQHRIGSEMADLRKPKATRRVVRTSSKRSSTIKPAKAPAKKAAKPRRKAS
jgi:hypothetical protein